MRIIKIDKNLIEFIDNFYNDLYKERSVLLIRPLERLKNLRRDYLTNSKERKLLEKLILDYDKILRYTPLEQDKLINELAKNKQLILFYNPNKKVKKGDKDKKTKFGKDIYNAFNYEQFRCSEAYKIVDRINIKTCVYCNAQLCVNIKTNSGSKSRLQFDHFFPKDRYPFLSISFFNLIPSCANCNLIKSNTNLPLNKSFHLYHNLNGLTPFYFKLDKKSVAKYILSKNKNDIEFKFQSKVVANSKIVEEHNKTFDVQSIYETQKDIAEEIINKAFYYNKIYKSTLRDSFEKIFPDEALVNRILVGNYSSDKDLHLRPMAKFCQDIAIQMDLLKLSE